MRIARLTPTRLLAGVGTMTMLAASLVFDVNPVGAAFPGRNGPIYCNSNRDGNTEIYAFYPDGSPPRRLTFNPASDFEATASPDGTRIAFTSTRENNDQEIWLMYQDGAGARRLTFATGEDRAGTFSPDGTRIAFHSGRIPAPPGPGHSSLEIFTMNADGSDVRRMTNNNFQDSFAHWSPNGDRIAFTTNRDGDFEIYTMVPVDADNDGNADVQSRVTNSPGEDAHAHWSPDASQLVFHSRRDATPASPGIIEIYRASSTNGSGAVRLTNDTVFDAFPSWSPDGQRVAWSRQFPSEVFTANASDGGAPTNVSNNAADDTRCDWSRLLPCTITGSGFINGTPGDDVICGSPGNDVIFGNGGNDVIYGGDGDDRISGGPGDDIIFGGRGNDQISGDDGNDTMFGDQGFDTLSGGPGNDIVSGSEDFDRVSGDDGTDECYGEQRAACEVAFGPVTG